MVIKEASYLFQHKFKQALIKNGYIYLFIQINMATIKEIIIEEIQNIKDESILTDIHQILQNVYNIKSVLTLNEAQKLAINEARQDYLSGKFFDIDALFNDLINE